MSIIEQLMETGLTLAEATESLKELKVDIAKATAGNRYYEIDELIKAKGLSPEQYFDIIFA